MVRDRRAFVNVVRLGPFESVVIRRRRCDGGPVVSHRRGVGDRWVQNRWRDPWRLVVVVIPPSIREITPVHYRAPERKAVDNISGLNRTEDNLYI